MTSPRLLHLLPAVITIALLAGCASGPPPTPVERGEAALAEGDWRTARTHFLEALQRDAGSGRAWSGRARAELMGRDPEAALRSLSRLAEVDRARFHSEAVRATYADTLEAVTGARLARDQAEPALAAARALARVEPARRGLDRLLGRALVAEAARRRWAGDPEAALPLYREACRRVPQTLDAWVGAAEILLEAGRAQEAVRLLEAARKTHPSAGEIRSLTLQALRAR
jgi:tetratricopeptide (TPR) repeat protein